MHYKNLPFVDSTSLFHLFLIAYQITFLVWRGKGTFSQSNGCLERAIFSLSVNLEVISIQIIRKNLEHTTARFLVRNYSILNYTFACYFLKWRAKNMHHQRRETGRQPCDINFLLLIHTLSLKYPQLLLLLLRFGDICHLHKS